MLFDIISRLRRLVIPLKGRQEKVFLLLALPFLPVKVPQIYSKFTQKLQGWFLQCELSRKKLMLFPSHLVTRDISKKTFAQSVQAYFLVGICLWADFFHLSWLIRAADLIKSNDPFRSYLAISSFLSACTQRAWRHKDEQLFNRYLLHFSDVLLSKARHWPLMR